MSKLSRVKAFATETVMRVMRWDLPFSAGPGKAVLGSAPKPPKQELGADDQLIGGINVPSKRIN